MTRQGAARPRLAPRDAYWSRFLGPFRNSCSSSVPNIPVSGDSACYNPDARIRVDTLHHRPPQFAYLAAIQFANAATATLLQFLFLPLVAGYEAVKGVLRWSVQWTVSLLLAMVGTLFLVGGVPGWNFRILVTSNGVLFGLLAAVSGAYYTLASRPLVHAHGSWWVTTWGFAIGGLVTVPFGVESFLNYQMPSTPYGLEGLVGLVTFVIVFGTILAYGLYLAGLRRLSATEIGLASSSEPIVAAVAAFVFLGVILTATQYLGGALIILAVVLLASRKPQEPPIS